MAGGRSRRLARDGDRGLRGAFEGPGREARGLRRSRGRGEAARLRRGGHARRVGRSRRRVALLGGSGGPRGRRRIGRCPRQGRGALRDRRDQRAGGERNEGAHDPVRSRVREGGGPRGEAHHGRLEGGLRHVMHFDVVTLFPEMFDALADHGITRRALDEKRFEMKTWDPRDFTKDNYRRVDDRPYGGGPGMVMMAEPLQAAIEAAKARQREVGVAAPKVLLMSPQGERLSEALVQELSGEAGLVVVAGRNEDVDKRLVATSVDREVSIGDYVSSRCELPAMVVIDCLVRRLPGSLNDAESASQDSFADGLLDWPHYTRPEKWLDAGTPEVLMSGNHAAIARWRRKQALGRTWDRRPDLIDEAKLSRDDRQLLEEYQREPQPAQQQQ